MQNASRNRLQVALDSGSILVNEKPVKPNYKVKPEDVITIVHFYPHTGIWNYFVRIFHWI